MIRSVFTMFLFGLITFTSALTSIFLIKRLPAWQLHSTFSEILCVRLRIYINKELEYCHNFKGNNIFSWTKLSCPVWLVVDQRKECGVLPGNRPPVRSSYRFQVIITCNVVVKLRLFDYRKRDIGGWRARYHGAQSSGVKIGIANDDKDQLDCSLKCNNT